MSQSSIALSSLAPSRPVPPKPQTGSKSHSRSTHSTVERDRPVSPSAVRNVQFNDDQKIRLQDNTDFNSVNNAVSSSSSSSSASHSASSSIASSPRTPAANATVSPVNSTDEAVAANGSHGDVVVTRSRGNSFVDRLQTESIIVFHRFFKVSLLKYTCGVLLFIQFISTCILSGADSSIYTPGYSPDSSTWSGIAAFMIIFFILQAFVFFGALVLLIFEFKHGVIKPSDVISMYIATIVFYGSYYQVCYTLNQSSMGFNAGVDIQSTNVFAMFITFQYFSVTAMSSLGLGDIFPVMWWAKMFCVTQLLSAVIFTAFLFGIGLDHFSLQLKKQKPRRNFGRIQSFFRDFRQRYPILDRTRKFLMEYVFFVSISWQIILMLIIYGIDPNVFYNTTHSSIVALVLVFQILQFLLILVATFRLIRQINVSYVSPFWLLQSYCATITLYAGVYWSIFLLAGVGSYAFNSSTITASDDTTSIFKTIGNMLYFSVVLMTTTGFGDTFPIHWTARILVISQMLVSVFYSAVILGIGMAHVVSNYRGQKEERLKAQIKKEREEAIARGEIVERSTNKEKKKEKENSDQRKASERKQDEVENSV